MDVKYPASIPCTTQTQQSLRPSEANDDIDIDVRISNAYVYFGSVCLL